VVSPRSRPCWTCCSSLSLSLLLSEIGLFFKKLEVFLPGLLLLGISLRRSEKVSYSGNSPNFKRAKMTRQLRRP